MASSRTYKDTLHQVLDIEGYYNIASEYLECTKRRKLLYPGWRLSIPAVDHDWIRKMVFHEGAGRLTAANATSTLVKIGTSNASLQPAAQVC